jgi:hypothetical protein
MRRAAVLLALLALVLPSCGKRGKESLQPKREGTAVLPADDAGKSENVAISLRPATPFFMIRSTVGDAVNAKGEVEKDNLKVAAGTAVHLTLYLKESPPGLQTGVVWYKDERPIRREVKPGNGQKVISYTLDDAKLQPGKYRVVAYWGGNVAADKRFELVPRAKQ